MNLKQRWLHFVGRYLIIIKCPKCGSTNASVYELLPDPDGIRRLGCICNACRHKWQQDQVR